MSTYLSIFIIFLRLGLTSFGGPVAHIGYFRNEFVARRGWLSEAEFADNLSLCQLIPGPASSQLGLLIGYTRAGFVGAALAWLGFTLPSALALGYLGVSLANPSVSISPLLLTLLKAIALAVILQAVIAMAKNFCKRRLTLALMVGSTGVLLLGSNHWITPLVILCAGLIALLTDKSDKLGPLPTISIYPKALIWLTIFFVGLTVLPLAADSGRAELLSNVYRAGALVFGGGHVVLPLLADATVNEGLLSSELFISGYGAAQAVPGPLFTFASFLGGAIYGSPADAVLATLAIFLPAVALLFGVFPIWEQVKSDNRFRIAVGGANAAVVGVLLAAFVTLSTQTLTSVYLALTVAALFVLIEWIKVPPWLLVLLAVGLSLIESWLV